MRTKTIKGLKHYTISDTGVVKNKTTGHILTGSQSRGYRRVHFRTGLDRLTSRRVHRLVALAFIPKPKDKNEVDHIDRNRLNNDHKNLRWVDSGENHRNSPRYKPKTYTCENCGYRGQK